MIKKELINKRRKELKREERRSTVIRERGRKGGRKGVGNQELRKEKRNKLKKEKHRKQRKYQ